MKYRWLQRTYLIEERGPYALTEALHVGGRAGGDLKEVEKEKSPLKKVSSKTFSAFSMGGVPPPSARGHFPTLRRRDQKGERLGAGEGFGKGGGAAVDQKENSASPIRLLRANAELLDGLGGGD